MKIPSQYFFPLLLWVLIPLFVGCQQRGGKSDADSHPAAQSIVIGLLPTTDCVPLLLAQENGLFDSLRLQVTFVHLNSQMEMDKQLAEGTIHLGTGDLLRTMRLQNEGLPVKFLLGSPRDWQLVANKKLRIRQANQLNDRMVGMARISWSDYYCEQLGKKIPRHSGQLLCPQINDLLLRTQMLEENQLDAAILPQPLATIARQHGHTMLSSCGKESEGWAGFAVNSLWADKHPTEILQFVQIYNKAAARLRQDSLRPLPETFIQNLQADSLQLIAVKNFSFRPLFPTEKEHVSQALQWMRQHKYVTPDYNTDTLFYHLKQD